MITCNNFKLVSWNDLRFFKLKRCPKNYYEMSISSFSKECCLFETQHKEHGFEELRKIETRLPVFLQSCLVKIFYWR